MTDDPRPPVRWVEIDETYTDKEGVVHRLTGVRAEHDGPCVFFEGRCSCGRLDLGIVRADPPPGPAEDLLAAMGTAAAAYRDRYRVSGSARLIVPGWMISRYGREEVERAATDEARRWGFADAVVEVYDR